MSYTSDECSSHLSRQKKGRCTSCSHSSCWSLLVSVPSRLPAALIAYIPHNPLPPPYAIERFLIPNFFQLSQHLLPDKEQIHEHSTLAIFPTTWAVTRDFELTWKARIRRIRRYLSADRKLNKFAWGLSRKRLEINRPTRHSVLSMSVVFGTSHLTWQMFPAHLRSFKANSMA